MTTGFQTFNLHPALQTALDAMGFTIPTPIQEQAIPPALMGGDILGSAQTGSGKTGAFCIPMIDFLLKNPQAHALVMLPTRELATQVHDVARKLIGTENRSIKTALLIGGEPIGKQYAQLDRRPRLFVGTPGRINDHLRSNPDLVDRVSFVVLDEADRMLDMGFAPQIDVILESVQQHRQTLMFSATFPDSIIKFSKKYLNAPERISIGEQSRPVTDIDQQALHIAHEEKYNELTQQLSQREGSVIVFVRTQHGADRLSEKLNRDAHKSEAIHGGLRQRQRDKVLGLFRKSHIRVLVATDVAARGLDVPHIEHVVNYDLPQVAEDYIHRIGRTARAGAKGNAVSFIAPAEKHLWRQIERMLDPTKSHANESREESRSGEGRKKYGSKPYGKKQGGKGGYGPRKPFGRADRKDRKENGWNPDADFQRSEPRTEGDFDPRPRRAFQDRPNRAEGTRDGGFKKPFKKREDDFASNPDSYKRTNSAERKEGGFKKSYGRDGAQSRTEGGYKKPYVKRDDNRADRKDEARPFRKEGERKERSGQTGFKKSYAKEGQKFRGGEGQRFRKEGGQRSSGGKRPF